jgi:heme iron utilization protein
MADAGRDARKLLRNRTFGVLATQSLDVPGYPFGSITPYVLDAEGDPLLLISGIAQHTKNLVVDPRCSITMWEDGEDDDVQAKARLTWIGDAAKVTTGREEAVARYLAYIPSAKGHFAAHDFSLWRITGKRGRYIGGFGAIHWVESADLRRENPLKAAESRIVKHMNDDHADALASFCRSFKELTPASVIMIGIDPEGFDVLADGKRLRFHFDEDVTTVDEARKMMVKLAQAAG